MDDLTPQGTRCCGLLAFEQIAGLLVTREMDGRWVYSWRCQKCAATGTRLTRPKLGMQHGGWR